MMNKSSSRLIAWLLAMVMILNIAPVTAFADYSNSLTQPVGEAAEVTVHYMPKSNGAKDSGNFSWNRQGNERTPTQTDAFWSYSGSLAGWSTVSDYTDRNSGLLFAPGSYIDFSMFPNSAVPRDITLYETAAIPVTVNVNGKINGQDVSTLYAIPGEKLEKPADPIPYDTYHNGSFKEWLKADGTEYDFDTIVTAPFTLTASYRTAGSTHTVHFQYNNGTPEVTVTVNDGAKVQRPTDPVVPSSWPQVFDFWAINEQNVPYDFDTPVTSDLWIGAVYKNKDAGSDNNNGSGNNNNSGSGNVSNESTEFVIQYLIAGDHNYVNQGEDIEFDRKTVTGVPSEYYNDNNKTRIADSKKQVYTNDTDPQSKVWDEESKTLKLYYSPITLTITLHYRRIKSDNSAENLDQTDGGKQHGYSGEVNPTYNKYNDTNLITALPQFTIPYSWIDVDNEFVFAGYKYGQNNDPQGRIENKDIPTDWIHYGSGANLDITLFYIGKTEEAEQYDDTVILTAASESRTYNGEALTNSNITTTGLPDGFRAEATVVGSQTDAGQSDNEISSYRIINTETNQDVTELFTNVTSVKGTLTINKAQLTVQTGSAEKAYDGNPLTKDEASITGLKNGETATVKATGSLTNVGSAVNAYEITWGTAKTANYEIIENLGTLKINAAGVTLTANSGTETYDGTEKTVSGFTSSIEGLTFEGVSASGSGTDAGTYDVTFTGVTVNETKDSTGNYVVTGKTDGTLTITAATFTVEDIDGVTYNGSEQKQPVVVKSGEKVLEEGTDYEVTYTGDTTNAGTVTVKIAGKGNYSGTEEKTYTIAKRNVTLTSEDGSKAYDGMPLTKPEVTIGGDGFVNGEVSEVKATGNVTTVAEGKVANTIVYTEGAAFKATNYNITRSEGKLSITAAAFTVEDIAAVKYDGSEQKQPVVVKSGDNVLEEGTDYEVTYTGDTTNAGEVTVTIAGKGNYSGTEEKTYTIAKRNVTLKSEGGSKAYDGEALTKPEVTIGEDGFVDGEVSEVKATGSVTTVEEGEVTNTIVYTEGAAFKAGNYNISKDEDILSITAATFTVEDIADVTYNGSEQKQAVVVKSGETVLTEGTDYDVTYTGDMTNAGTVTVTITGKGNYTGQIVKTYAINLKPVTVTADDKTRTNRVIDSDPDLTWTAEGLVNEADKELLSVTINRENSDKIDPGTYSITATGEETQGNYLVTYKPGTLTITDVSATLYNVVYVSNNNKYYRLERQEHGILANNEVQYFINRKNGTKNTLTDQDYSYLAPYSFEGKSITIDGVEYKYQGTSYNPAIKEPYFIYESVEIKAENRIGCLEGGIPRWAVPAESQYDDVPNETKNFKRNITIRLFVPEVEQDLYNFLQVNLGSKFDFYRLQKQKITAPPVEDLLRQNLNGKDLVGSTEYTVKCDPEEYSFTNVVLKHTDGTDYIYRDNSYEPDSKIYEPYYTVEDKYTIKPEKRMNNDDGWYKNPAGWLDGEAWGVPNQTSSYHRNYVAHLHKSPYQRVTLVANSNSDAIAYDGEAHTVSEFRVLLDGKDITEKVTFDGVSASVSGTDAGTYKNQIQGVTIDDTVDTTDTYVVTEVIDGTLTIDPASVTLTAASAEKTYNGEAQAISGYTSSVEGLTFEGVSASGTGTNAGTYGVTFTGVTVSKTKDTTGNYVVTGTTDGTLTINAAGVTLTANSGTEPYDGTEKAVSGFTSSIEGLTFEGVSASGTGTNAGTYGVTFTGVTVNETKDTTGNYVVTGTTDGTLTINPASVTLTATSESKTYNGEEQTITGYTSSVEGLTFEGVSASGTGTNAGTYGVTFTGVTVNETKDTTGNYVVTGTTDGTLTINPASVTLTATSEAKTYNGEAQTITGFTSSVEGLTFEGVSASGTGTNAGTYGVTFTGVTVNETKDTTGNYVVTGTTDGTLTITKAALTVTAEDKSKTYGEADPELTWTVEGLKNGDTRDILDVTISRAEGQNAGNYKITASGAAETDNYTITYVEGNFAIGAKAITITADSKTKTYDNDASTDPELTVSAPGVVDGDSIHYTISRQKGQNAGTYAITVAADENPNYEVNVVPGIFTITPKTIAVSANNAGKVYGESDPELTATVTDAVAGDTINYTVSRAAGEDAGEYAITVAAGENPNYTVNVSGATFTITPKPVTIAVDNNSKTYGEDDPDFTGTVTGLVSEGDLGEITYSRSNAEVQNAGTYADVLDASFTANKNYAVTVTKGSFTIEKVKDVVVTITGHNNTAPYDGTEHSISGYDVSISNPLYKATDISFSGSDSAVQTDAGTAEMGLKAEQFTNTNSNFEGVTFKVTDGYQTISQIDVTVTITGHNGEADYDGQEHTLSGYDVSISNPLYTTADFALRGNDSISGTDAGTYNTELTADSFTNKNNNFNVTFDVHNGQLVINKIDAVVTITEHSDTADYDGEEHTVTGYDVKNIQVNGKDTDLYTENDFTFKGTDSVSGIDAGSYVMELKAEDFTNTNENFNTVTFKIEDGQLVINPIDVTVTITGHNDSTTYDGVEHIVTGYDVEISNPLYTEDDFTFTGTASAARTVVGTQDMKLTETQFENTNPNFNTVTFEITDGYQTIVPVEEVVVTITGHNGTADYDGAAHTVSGYDVKISDPLYTEDDFTFTPAEGMAEGLEISRTDAGTTYMGLAAEQFANTNRNFAKVTFNVTDGYQTIKPINATVTITENSDEVNYNGEPHNVTGYTAAASTDLYNVKNDFTFSGTASISGTNAGTYDMELKAGDFTNNNPNFGNVTFVIADGQLKIKPIDVTVTITEHSGEFNYDGEAHTVTGYDFAASNALYTQNDFTFSGNDSVTAANAGSHSMELKTEDFTNTSTNFANVTFVIVENQMVIKPIDVTVTVTGANNTTDYDGATHTVEGFTATASSSLYDVTKDFTFSGSKSVSRTDAGTTKMGLKAEQFTNNNTNFNVTFDVKDGYQTISPIDVTVNVVGANNTTDYDGKEHEVTGYTATASSTLYDVTKDFTHSGAAAAKRTDAGTTNMGLAAEQFENTNPNFGTVTFNVTDGYQTINPISVIVTITENSDSINYDGAEHTVTGYTAEADSDLYDVTKDFEFNGTASITATNAGSHGMDLKPEDFRNTNSNFNNVTFVIEDRVLEIKPIDVTVTITGANSTNAYDGEEHSVSGYTATADTTLYDVTKDITFSGTAAAARTDVGTTNMGLAASQFANNNPNFGTVTFNVTDGYQTITPINAIVTIVGASNTATYDSKEHSVSGYTATADTDLYDVTKDFTFSGTASAARTDEGTTTMNLAAEQFVNTNANFAAVTFNVTDGYQAITPIDEVVVTITGHSNTTPYDGTEHTISGYDVKISNELYKETDFTFRGTAEAALTNAGTATMGLKADQFTNTNSNFAKVIFNVTDGYQTITKINATVTITGASNAADYDGTEHSVSGYTATADTNLYDVTKDFTFNGTDAEAQTVATRKAAGMAAAARTDAGTTNMGLAAEQFANKNPNFDVVTFNVVDGFQKINAINVTVTITENSGEFTYDGKSHAVTGYKVTSIKLGEEDTKLYTDADFTFKGTDSVSATDAGSYDMELKESDFVNTNENFASVTFKIVDGQLVIKPLDVKVTITGTTSEVDYDGKEHKVSGYTAAADNDLYDVTQSYLGFNGTGEAVLTKAGTVNMGLAKEQFTNSNKNFNVTFDVKDGYQKINKVKVTVTAENKERTSHFAESEEPELTVIISGLVNSEPESLIRDVIKVSRTQGEKLSTPGEYDIVVDGPKEIDNYEIEYVGAKMNVTNASDPLYNFAMINNKWYRLQKQENGIITDKPLSEYVKGLNVGSQRVLSEDQYEVIPYDFTKETIIFNGKEYVYSADGRPNPEYPEKSFYTVARRPNDFVIAMKNRISGGTDNWIIPEDERYTDPTGNKDSFHRNFDIKLYEAVVVVANNGANNVIYNGVLQSTPAYHSYTSWVMNDDGTRTKVSLDFGFHPYGEGINAGDYKIDFKDFEYGKIVNDKYFAAKSETGILTIKTREVVIRANDSTFTYNGTSRSNQTWKIKSGKIGPNDTLTAVVEGSITNVSESPVVNKLVSYELTTADPNNIHVTTEDGTLKMNPAEVTITTKSATKVYDGQPLTSGKVETKPLQNKEKITVIPNGSITDVGSISNTYDIEWGTTDPRNYRIKENLGTLTVTPSSSAVVVTITEHGGEAKYDGEEHTVTGYDVTSITVDGKATTLYTADDFSFSGDATITGTDAGTYDMNLASTDFTNTNTNFTNVTFVIVDGSLVIGKRSVTLTSATDSKVYDKTALTNDTVTVTGDGFATGEGAAYDVTGSQTDAGESANAFTYTLNEGTKADNYDITKAEGTLTVTTYDEAITVTITEHSGEAKYDGEEHTVTGYDVTSIKVGENDTTLYTTDDFSFSGDATITGTDAGTYDMNLAPANFTNTNDNFTNVTFVIVDGSLVIGKRSVTLTSADDEKVYDKTALTNDTVTVTGDGFVEGEGAAYDVTGSQTNAGESANAFTYTLNEGTKADNYDISKVEGTLTVTTYDEAITVTITEHGGEAKYDGEEHTVTGYDVTSIKVGENDTTLYTADDFSFSGDATITGTDAGTYDMNLAPANFTNTNDNFTNVTFVIVDGSLVIGKRSVTLTSADAEKTYDGTALENSEVTVSGDGFVTGEGASYNVTGTIIDPGTASNAFTYTLNEGTLADNYNITTVAGTLTINKVTTEIVITAASDSKKYDGSALTNSGYTYTEGVLAEGDVLTAVVEGTITNYGTAANKVTGYKVMRGESDVTTNYTFGESVDGELEITKRSVTLTSADAEKTYDGTALENSEVTVSGDGFVTGEGATYNVTGTIIDPGTASNAFTYTLNEGTLADNYDISKVEGTLTVTTYDEAITVTITEHGGEAKYDGEEHTVTGYDVTSIKVGENDTTLYTADDFSFSGDATITGTNAGTYAMGLTAANFTNDNKNFTNVTFVIVDGSLVISPIDVTVTITGYNNTADYDGAEHAVSGYDVEIGNDLYKEADFTFSGEAAAARTDAGTTNMGLEAGQFTNTNPNFGTVTFNVTDGYQTINPIDVTVEITGHKNTATYDSAEHSVSGYDVKIGNSLYKEADFTFSGTAEAKRTEEGTTNMGLAEEQFANTNGNFRTVTFTVTDGYQTITPVDEVVVTITGHKNTADYDGNEHSVSGYDVEISNDLYKEADFTFNGTAAAVRTDAGTTNMGLNEAQFSNTNKNFAKVTFEVTDGYQTISPISAVVTITGHNSTADYNGAEHTVTGYDVEISNPLYKEADFTFNGDATAKRTDAGTTNMNLASSQFVNNNGNFNSVTFNVADGYQTISPIDAVVTIAGANNTTDYDGKEHSVSGYTATADTDLYDVTKDFTFSGTAAAARTDAGTTNMGLAAEQFVNINPNFATVTFNVTDGYQTINPINATVTIVGASNTATYDSEEHSVSGYTATADTELYDVENDFTFSGTASAARTDEGTTTMNLAAEQFENTNANFATVTFNVTDGYQAITPIDEVVVTITGNSNTTAYDGEEHSVSGYEVKISNPLYKESDFTFSGTAEAAQTDAGTTNMGLAAEQFANTNGNFAKVTFNVTDGYQTITPINATVTITGANNTADYDGEEHSVSGYTATANTGLYDVTKDFTFSGTAAAARTDAGTTNMGLAADQFANTNPNFATVTFNVTDGYQKIEQIDAVVTISGANNTADYDGEEHSVSGYTATANTELYDVTKDFTFSGTAAAARTDAGTTNMNLESGQFANTNGNFKSVTFNVTDGYQTITPIDAVVTISGANNTADYDGEEHSVSGYTATADTRLYDVTKDFTFNGTAAAARTDAGTTNMNLTAEQFVNTNPNFATVTFNVTDGYQTINPIDVTVTITEHSDTVTYNAAEHTVTGYDTAIGNELYKVTDFIFSGNDSVSGTNAGTYDMNLTAADFTNINANFANVTFVIIDGTLTINPKKITITADDKTMIYGDDEPVLTATTAGLEGSDYIATTQTREAGKDIGTYTITVTPVADPNYEITTETGTLTIQPRPVTVTAMDKAKTYGTADPALTATVTGMATGESASLIKYELSRATGEDVGEYAINATGDEAQGNYSVSYVPATLTILPEDAVVVTITANNGEYEYDGTQRDLSGYSVSISNDLYKESDFTFNGSNTLRGVNAGTYRTDMKASDFVNTNTNFENVKFIVENGALEITKRNVTLTSGSAEKTFDGTPLTNEEITISGDGFATDEGVNVTVTGRRTTEGESDNTFTYTMAANTQAGNYDITSEFGKLKVTENEGDELVEYHKLTITYQYENGDIIKTFARDYMAGTRYYVASDKIANYKADTAAVSGTMGNADINVTVVYSKATHTLTVKFVSMTDSGQVTTPITMELTSGDSYTVFVPAVEGYTAMTEKVTGIMPDSDRSVTVFFLPEGTEAGIAGIGGGAQIPIEIDDFGTPLGIGDSILGGGEVIE